MCLLMYLRKEITEEILNNIFFKAITLAIRKLGISVGKSEGFLKNLCTLLIRIMDVYFSHRGSFLPSAQ